MQDRILVVKIGGSTLDSKDTTIRDLVTIQKKGRRVVVVHGGAKTASTWLAKFGIPSRFVEGLRVTDKESLDIVTAVFAGLVNKELVAIIYNAGGKAVGLSGSDGSLLWSKIHSPRLGYVGDIIKVNHRIIELVLNAGYMPVIAPISLGEFEGHTTLLNVNGDTVAGKIAASLCAEKLIFLTDVNGIYNSSGELLTRLSIQEAKNLIASGTASGGMIPKINACIEAAVIVPVFHIINGNKPHALIESLNNDHTGGTIIESE
jgi:acetylglutamate kinase